MADFEKSKVIEFNNKNITEVIVDDDVKWFKTVFNWGNSETSGTLKVLRRESSKFDDVPLGDISTNEMLYLGDRISAYVEVPEGYCIENYNTDMAWTITSYVEINNVMVPTSMSLDNFEVGKNFYNFDTQIIVNPIYYILTFSSDFGYATAKVKRTYTEASAPLGYLNSGDHIYKNDKLVLEYTFNDGYEAADNLPSEITVSWNTDIQFQSRLKLVVVSYNASKPSSAYSTVQYDLAVAYCTRTRGSYQTTGRELTPSMDVGVSTDLCRTNRTIFYGDSITIDNVVARQHYEILDNNFGTYPDFIPSSLTTITADTVIYAKIAKKMLNMTIDYTVGITNLTVTVTQSHADRDTGFEDMSTVGLLARGDNELISSKPSQNGTFYLKIFSSDSINTKTFTVDSDYYNLINSGYPTRSTFITEDTTYTYYARRKVDRNAVWYTFGSDSIKLNKVANPSYPLTGQESNYDHYAEASTYGEITVVSSRNSGGISSDYSRCFTYAFIGDYLYGSENITNSAYEDITSTLYQAPEIPSSSTHEFTSNDSNWYKGCRLKVHTFTCIVYPSNVTAKVKDARLYNKTGYELSTGLPILQDNVWTNCQGSAVRNMFEVYEGDTVYYYSSEEQEQNAHSITITQDETIEWQRNWDGGYLFSVVSDIGLTLEFTRTSSPSGKGSLGRVYDGDVVWPNDVLSVSYTLSTGYELAQTIPSSVTMGLEYLKPNYVYQVEFHSKLPTYDFVYDMANNVGVTLRRTQTYTPTGYETLPSGGQLMPTTYTNWLYGIGDYYTYGGDIVSYKSSDEGDFHEITMSQDERVTWRAYWGGAYKLVYSSDIGFSSFTITRNGTSLSSGALIYSGEVLTVSAPLNSGYSIANNSIPSTSYNITVTSSLLTNWILTINAQSRLNVYQFTYVMNDNEDVYLRRTQRLSTTGNEVYPSGYTINDLMPTTLTSYNDRGTLLVYYGDTVTYSAYHEQVTHTKYIDSDKTIVWQNGHWDGMYQLVYSYDSGFDTFTVERISSPSGASIGVISNYEELYANDVIEITWSLKTGYELISTSLPSSGSQITVSGSLVWPYQSALKVILFGFDKSAISSENLWLERHVGTYTRTGHEDPGLYHIISDSGENVDRNDNTWAVYYGDSVEYKAGNDAGNTTSALTSNKKLTVSRSQRKVYTQYTNINVDGNEDLNIGGNDYNGSIMGFDISYEDPQVFPPDEITGTADYVTLTNVFQTFYWQTQTIGNRSYSYYINVRMYGPDGGNDYHIAIRTYREYRVNSTPIQENIDTTVDIFERIYTYNYVITDLT